MKYTSIKYYAMAFTLFIAFTSCKQGESLQGYYVANQETPNFISVDIPASFIDLDQVDDLTDDQKEAYDSMDKLNMLGYRVSENNQEEYKAELEKVQILLKDEKYEELFRGGNSSDGKIIVKYIGTDTTIDELIIFGNANDTGFAIIRVLGDDMEPAKIMTLGNVASKLSSDESMVNDFMGFFKGVTGDNDKEINDITSAIDSIN
ncbi:MAG: DUF4252 domain-containing protein [Flavobacteriaceae bacterium]|nr:DUF4252 domain-containing protein [Flavobacteriaceae bacterium]